MMLDNIADIYVSVDYEHNKKFMINSPLFVLSHKCIKFTSEGSAQSTQCFAAAVFWYSQSHFLSVIILLQSQTGSELNDQNNTNDHWDG